MASQQTRCWCGNPELTSFSADYSHCPSCGTLVCSVPFDGSISEVTDDETAYYGRHYWFSHQENDLSQPDIVSRSRTDLIDRGLHWLRTILKFKLPGSKVLDVGCAHGGGVALLRQAGFNAEGLELSPWMVDFARQTFHIPVSQGLLEEQPYAPSSFDAIAFMDVIEHLPDPVKTLSTALDLLKPDGILIIQTPRYPEGTTYEELVANDSPFIQMMIPKEHLFLFSEGSIRRFFEELGARYVQFEPAVFSQYDMFLAVSKQPVVAIPSNTIEEGLLSTPSGRMALALLDLASSHQHMVNQYQQADADRVTRLENLQDLEAVLKESEADRAARLEVIHALEARLSEAEALAKQQGQRIQQQEDLNRAQTKMIAEIQSILNDLRNSRSYHLLRRMGRLEWFEIRMNDIMSRNSAAERAAQSTTNKPSIRRIVVDLTPVRPGGENGGAKLLALELVKQWSQTLAPETEYILLTSSDSHEELAWLDAPNVRRVCANTVGPQPAAKPPHRNLRHWVRRGLEKVLPPAVMRKVYASYQAQVQRPRQSSLVSELQADLVFCPFTAPFYYDPDVPIVIMVHDLQYKYYPQFFTAEENFHTDRYFKQSCQVASRLICVSEYTRETVLKNAEIQADRISVIHNSLNKPLELVSRNVIDETLQQLNLVEDRFLFYPANFWPHKNHNMLLTAFGMYCRQHPQSDLRLVLTGALGERMNQLQEAAQQMGLSDRVDFRGYVGADVFNVLMQSCRALIFPSLYEGFGIPVVEAMASGKPVLCSNNTSLPEVAQDAALYFDPRKPDEIVTAIDRIEHEPGVHQMLVEKGRQRAKAFADPTAWANEYIKVFKEVVRGAVPNNDALHGEYPDGWFGETAGISFAPSAQSRTLEMKLCVPPWLPESRLAIRFTLSGEERAQVFRIRRGETQSIRVPLPQTGGKINVHFMPAVRPAELGLNEDQRLLSCQCLECRITTADGSVVLAG